jgi:hypothetical protein
MVDERRSRENATHVLRAMNESSRQGFDSGSPAPRQSPRRSRFGVVDNLFGSREGGNASAAVSELFAVGLTNHARRCEFASRAAKKLLLFALVRVHPQNVRKDRFL